MSLENVLKKNRERDIRMKSTSAGPHRDDVCFVTDKGLDIRKFRFSGTAEDSCSVTETFRNRACKTGDSRYANSVT